MALTQKWKDSINTAISDKRWDEYDALIQCEVSEYNRRFSGMTGYVNVDWKLFKAVLWTESGGPTNTAWKGRAMQIGNTGDKGYLALKSGQEASLLIMSEQLAKDIKTGDINKPELNIRAGIAYALNRLVQTDIKSVDDPADKATHDYTVRAGDNLSKIAAALGTTVASLQQLNPTAKVLHAGQKLKYRKAAMKRVILRWSSITTAAIASTYNVGDLAYKEKLDYVLTVFPKLKR